MSSIIEYPSHLQTDYHPHRIHRQYHALDYLNLVLISVVIAHQRHSLIHSHFQHPRWFRSTDSKLACFFSLQGSSLAWLTAGGWRAYAVEYPWELGLRLRWIWLGCLCAWAPRYSGNRLLCQITVLRRSQRGGYHRLRTNSLPRVICSCPFPAISASAAAFVGGPPFFTDLSLASTEIRRRSSHPFS